MIKSQEKRRWILPILISSLVALLGQQGCTPSPTSPRTSVPPIVMPVVAPTREVAIIPLGLNPSKTILNPGDQVVISVISKEWDVAELTWELFSKNLRSPGALSTSVGPTVVYTAPPATSGEVSISVIGRTKGGAVGSASVSFSIRPKSLEGVVEFWTLPDKVDSDTKRASDFRQVYPNILVKIVSISIEDAQAKLQTAIAAGAAPDVVRFSRIAEVQVLGKSELLDADAATRIILEIGKDKFDPALLNALRDPADNTRWLAIPAEQGSLAIIIGTENKSVAEAWMKFLIEKELSLP